MAFCKSLVKWIVLAGILSSCAKFSRPSELKQLTKEMYDCQVADDARTQQVWANMPANFIRNFSEAETEQIKKMIAVLPDEYIQHLFDANAKAQFHITKEFLGSGIKGLTQYSYYPMWTKISSDSDGIVFALIHELGHALEYYVTNTRSGGSEMYNQVTQLYQTEGARASTLRSYARSSRTEYFAESFQNYYCSPEAQGFIATTLPQTFSFLTQALLKPFWDGGGQNPGTNTDIASNPPTTDPGTNNNGNSNPGGNNNGNPSTTRPPAQLPKPIYKLVPIDPSQDQYVLLAISSKSVSRFEACFDATAGMCERTSKVHLVLQSDRVLPDGRQLFQSDVFKLPRVQSATINSNEYTSRTTAPIRKSEPLIGS